MNDLRNPESKPNSLVNTLESHSTPLPPQAKHIPKLASKKSVKRQANSRCENHQTICQSQLPDFNRE
jgi:hypothetical protein